MARPKIEINPEEVYKLAVLHATNEEIGWFLGCSKDTIERRFAAELKKGRAEGKIRLRKYQMALAEKNAIMAIWLGKQMLGQRDNIDISTEVGFEFASEDKV